MTLTPTGRAAELIETLGLTPHPEGGYFREIFRSRRMVRTDDGRSERWAATTIYYLLAEGDVSRLHRVASDELWHFYEGAPLELHVLNQQSSEHRALQLGPVCAEGAPVRVVPAGAWQAARSLGAYTLVGCTVAPGFEFSDFRLMSAEPQMVAATRATFPALTPYL
jgi:predicted cupin superfamily sugar epimerase